MRLLFALAAIAIATPALAVQPVSIPGLYNTGVDNAGVATTGSASDLHWVRALGIAYTGGTNGQFPIGPWLAETTTSRWVTPGPDAGADFDPNVNGIYTYITTFSLNGFNAASAAFTGRFAADNFVSSITLNGVTINGSGGNFTDWTAFSSTSGSFLSGVNTLVFTVENGAQLSGNPTGLRVEFLSSSVNPLAGAVPEPAMWLMMIAGFGLVGVSARRRSSAAAA